MTQFEKATRLSKLAIEFNVGVTTLVDYLKKKGHEVDSNPNSKVAPELCELIAKEYGKEANLRDASKKLSLKNLREKRATISISDMDDEDVEKDDADSADGKSDEVIIKVTSEVPQEKMEKKEEPIPVVENQPITDVDIKVVGKIDLEEISHKRKKHEDAPVHEEEVKAEAVIEEKVEVKPVEETSKPESEAPQEIKKRQKLQKLPLRLLERLIFIRQKRRLS